MQHSNPEVWSPEPGGFSRRDFLKWTAAGAVGAGVGFPATAQIPRGERPPKNEDVQVLHPQNRIPLSFIIDDSTCLVNMGHFCIPQFAEAWPEREVYKKPWKTWPREIPDSFVREFGEWCAEQGVKGKYSIVPYPACVGWLDRELPGWSRKELQASLKLVRELMVPNWDIHPEMITHTRVIDLRTGRPFNEISPATMENSYPREHKSVDELAAYLAYALKILKNCDLPCEGVTTPGGFGNLVKPELSLAVQQAVRDVYDVEIPHFFKYVVDPQEGTEPSVEHVSGLGTSDLNLTVNVPAGTGDWFGSWEGDVTPEPDRYATADASAGRMVEMIERGQPAVMLCHWPGMYCNGTKVGFQAFQRVVTSLNHKYGKVTQWMKLSEMARYWAVKELAGFATGPHSITVDSPFACPQFTIKVSLPVVTATMVQGATRTTLQKKSDLELESGTFCRDGETATLCFDVQRGKQKIELALAQ